jgi:hypothetical protein
MTIKEENSIGARLVRAFGAKDLKEVAQMLGENYSSLHNWSTKRRDFPTSVLIKIARMTNESIDWILTGDEGERRAGGAFNFEKMFEEKIREIVRDEIAEGTAIHEKIQGIILAMQPNVNEQDAFKKTNEEEKAA